MRIYHSITQYLKFFLGITWVSYGVDCQGLGAVSGAGSISTFSKESLHRNDGSFLAVAVLSLRIDVVSVNCAAMLVF